jgi:hypothetical protein
MFLVSSVKADDPLATLCALAREKMKVTVVVDRSQAATTPYVRTGLQKLVDAGAQVFTESGKGGESTIMHDKLVFAHHPETKEGGSERYTVMIGSSGLTYNVVENLNYENLLIIDDEKLFKDLKGHHDKAQPKRRAGIPPIKERSDLFWVHKALTDAIPARDSAPVKQSVIKKQLVGKDQSSMFDDVVAMLGMKKYRQPDNSVLIGY